MLACFMRKKCHQSHFKYTSIYLQKEKYLLAFHIQIFIIYLFLFFVTSLVGTLRHIDRVMLSVRMYVYVYEWKEKNEKKK